ncbi:MAG: hypothetical protein FWG56_01860 [Desulfovibrionaceae bacterium]|nr:hypothetical protein [Desulfovibrionaceae bacterium]
MKKSILSLGVAAALGGLGLAGTAGAVAVWDNEAHTVNEAPYNWGITIGSASTDTYPQADKLVQHPAGTGHILVVPYYSAQGQNQTLINIVNTDTVNAKAVKVRFRGATNSDDVLDFTVLMSPGDVWSGGVVQDATGMMKIIKSGDETTCTIPDVSGWDDEGGGTTSAASSSTRLPGYLSGDQQAAMTREGYVEIMNMADIPQTSTTTKTSLYEAIKHVSGKAPCTAAPIAFLMTTDTVDVEDMAKYGLSWPTGGLMGSWAVMNQTQTVAFSGTSTAMIATAGTLDASGTAPTAAAGVAFFPQTETVYGINDYTRLPAGATTIPAHNFEFLTADPLLTTSWGTPLPGTGSSWVQPLWFDVPDLSTPIIPGAKNDALPELQAKALSDTIAKNNVMNEWIATKDGGFATDWVISQPTRRYMAAVWYDSSSGTSKALYNTQVVANPYDGMLTLKPTTTYGPMLCANYAFGAADREEDMTSGGAQFSPRTSTSTCGEVMTIQFGQNSVLDAAITASSVKSTLDKQVAGDAGWGVLSTPGGRYFPMIGWSGTKFMNGLTGAYYSFTEQHRWTSSY